MNNKEFRKGIRIDVVDGEYLQVTLDDGSTAYTKGRTFNIASDGRIVTEEGYVLEPQITIVEEVTELNITDTGEVKQTIVDDEQTIGQLTVATFENEANLVDIGNGYFTQGTETETIQNPTGLQYSALYVLVGKPTLIQLIADIEAFKNHVQEVIDNLTG